MCAPQQAPTPALTAAPVPPRRHAAGQGRLGSPAPGLLPPALWAVCGPAGGRPRPLPLSAPAPAVLGAAPERRSLRRRRLAVPVGLQDSSHGEPAHQAAATQLLPGTCPDLVCDPGLACWGGQSVQPAVVAARGVSLRGSSPDPARAAHPACCVADRVGALVTPAGELAWRVLGRCLLLLLRPEPTSAAGRHPSSWRACRMCSQSR